MIATKIVYGQGLGNQLFCYVTTRCIAKRNGYDFCILNEENALGDPRFNDKGIFWMDLDMGVEFDPRICHEYVERDTRLILPHNSHDATVGLDIRNLDKSLLDIPDNTIISGIMQDEGYFMDYIEDVKQWLTIKPEYDFKDLVGENVCVINFRGNEYVGSPTMLPMSYWKNAMNVMRERVPGIKFVCVTDDAARASFFLGPDVPVHQLPIDQAYATIHNASYLILSNSSFALMPTFTSTTKKSVIAPKYWARHETSSGYWATEQNLYSDFLWMEYGVPVLKTSEECRHDLEEWKKNPSA